MLARQPNLSDVDNTDIFNSELKMKCQYNAICVDNESDKDNTLCIALLYQYRTHTFAQIFIECSRINYVSNAQFHKFEFKLSLAERLLNLTPWLNLYHGSQLIVR